MPLRNTEYGSPQTCECDDCDLERGAPQRAVYTYGCCLCVFHEDQYQLGLIDLPDSASDSRKAAAESEVLG